MPLDTFSELMADCTPAYTVIDYWQLLLRVFAVPKMCALQCCLHIHSMVQRNRGLSVAIINQKRFEAQF